MIKSIGSYMPEIDEHQQAFFDGLDYYGLLEWVTALSQMALDIQSEELAKSSAPDDLVDGIRIPY